MTIEILLAAFGSGLLGGLIGVLIGVHGEFLISSQSSGYAPLARVKGDKRSTLEKAEANAQLMAAAPDLLVALYSMMEHCYDPDRNDDIVKAFDLARDAIAKAEGFK
jgi:hypothetical protein